MFGVLGSIGSLLCQVLDVIGLGAPAACFNGDTFSVGFLAITLGISAVTAILNFPVRPTPAVGMIVFAVSVLGVGSALIVRAVQ